LPNSFGSDKQCVSYKKPSVGSTARGFFFEVDGPVLRGAKRLAGKPDCPRGRLAVAIVFGFIDGNRSNLLHPGPVSRNADWLDWGNQPQAKRNWQPCGSESSACISNEAKLL
jgi:hypothetical protein